jgi:hypothetical protein
LCDRRRGFETKHHQDQEVVADPVPALLGRGEKPVDIWLAEVVPAADMGVCGPVVGTLDISPVDHARALPPNPLSERRTTLYTRHLL